MKKISILTIVFVSVFFFACSNQKTAKPPLAEKIPQGVFDNRIDNYFWMRLSDEQKSVSTPDEQTARVLDYLNRENEYTKTVLRHTGPLQKTIFDEIVGRIKKDDESVPYLKDGYYYYNKYFEGKEYPVYYRKKGSLDAPEELLLDVNKDDTVYFEADETFSVYLGETKSRKYILIQSDQTLTTETRFIDASKPYGDFIVFEPRKVNHEYQIDHLGKEFYIRTNTDGAKNFKLMKCAEGKTTFDNWTDVIPHRSDVLFERFELFDNYLVAAERIKGLSNLRIISKRDKGEHYIDFGEETYTARINVNPNANTDILRYSYSSMTTPNSVIDYNMVSREKKVLKEEAVLGGFDKSNYESKRLWATAQDDTMVPISLVYRKGFVRDGKSPLLLYGYGSYGSSQNPSFSPSVLSLLDRGFVFALSHTRGGSDLGRYWYEDGKLLKKINTFADFNDCAQFLIDEKYTSNENLFAMGGSAGGLLMGAIVNMKPELYKGVIAAVPFVDVVSTMLDETIPLTTSEWDEWGDPRKKEHYEYMLSYSPYDQVKAMDYPNLLVTTGYWDSQVQYWEPAKWVAKLRDMKTDKNILVMDVNMDAGHGGASGRFKRYRVTALEYAFILDLAGIKQ